MLLQFLNLQLLWNFQAHSGDLLINMAFTATFFPAPSLKALLLFCNVLPWKLSLQSSSHFDEIKISQPSTKWRKTKLNFCLLKRLSSCSLYIDCQVIRRNVCVHRRHALVPMKYTNWIWGKGGRGWKRRRKEKSHSSAKITLFQFAVVVIVNGLECIACLWLDWICFESTNFLEITI